MKTIFMLLIVALLTASSKTAMAQFGAEINAAYADKLWGGELGLGYAFKLGKWIRVTPAGGVLFYGASNSGYYEDNNGGNPRCRNASNGQYADSGDCSGVAANLYGRVEATYFDRKRLAFGVGGRFGDQALPYGTFAYSISPKCQAKVNGGPDYYALGIRFGF